MEGVAGMRSTRAARLYERNLEARHDRLERSVASLARALGAAEKDRDPLEGRVRLLTQGWRGVLR